MESKLQALDIFFRFASLGQLALFFALLIARRRFGAESILLLLLCPSVAAYLLLSAPLEQPGQAYRGLLLTLAHAVPYLVWALGLRIFNESFRPARWPFAARIAVALLVVTHIYYFGVLDGRGPLHDLIHALYLALFGHLMFMAVSGLRDDLLQPRRRFRFLLLAFVSVQLSLIVLVELTEPSFADPRVFSMLNAGLFFFAITAIGVHLVDTSSSLLPSERQIGAPSATDPAAARPDPDGELHGALAAFMQSGGYRMPRLSIGRLAEELSVPEHRLRRLINQSLGFRNFSDFLNQHRIREACAKLRDPSSSRTPVLTIALDLGYGSVGAFNRAFKAQTGQTPTEYRKTASAPCRN